MQGEFPKGLKFLQQAVPDLAKSPAVLDSAKHFLGSDFESRNKDLDDEHRLEMYLHTLETLLKHNSHDQQQERSVFEDFKNYLIKKSVIKIYKENGGGDDKEDRKLLKEISRNLYKAEKELDRSQGRGADVSEVDKKLGSLNSEEKDDKLIEIYRPKIIEAQKLQKQSLGYWIDYIAREDVEYPVSFKLAVIKSIAGLGQLDEETLEFKKRFRQTLTPFPEVNEEAVGLVYTQILENPDEQKDFNKLYAKYLVQVKSERRENLSDEGEWDVFKKGSGSKEAMSRVAGFGTGWCISTNLLDMERYLKNGDLHIFFSIDEHGKPIIPRVCIYVENGNVREIRGISANQNLEVRMNDVVEKKKSELPGGNIYDKRVGDMKFLTAIEKKANNKKELSKDELVFLYEMNQSISYFGYQPDPRIAELRAQINSKEDALVVFDCESSQIAYSLDELNKDTKAYIGKWNPEIHYKIKQFLNIEYLYESFPEKKILRKTIELTTKTSALYKEVILKDNSQISPYAEDILNKIKPLKQNEKVDLVSFSVEQLGFPNGATLREIYRKAKSLGLELCPPQVGPELRLAYKDQPMNEWLRIAMDSITDRDVVPILFRVELNDDGLWLGYDFGDLDSKWDGDNRFVFLSRKN